ncbi:MAG: autotransporter-associated beta strand repeat-containing protein [Pirellulales bacterium]
MIAGLAISHGCCGPLSAATSTWVSPSPAGLIYREQADGDRIPDFSMVGYGAGWSDLPGTPAVVLSVTPITGDNTTRIQNAINSAAALPLQANGYRGTVQLTAGDYEIAGQIKISASGIVLRGAGRDLVSGSATRLIATGTSTRDVISIGSTSSSPNYSGFSKIAIAEARVPVGATSFTVASTTGLSVGHTINVNWTSNQAWINANGMNLLDNPWQPGDRQQNSDRVITRIEGNRVYLDAPITSAIETIYGGGTIQRYNGFTTGGRITNVGVENLVGQSLATRDELNENRAWSFIGVESAENVFVRQIEARHFVYSAVDAKDYSKFVTTSDARSLLASGTITGSRRYTYNVDGQLVLVTNSTASDGRHDFVNGSNTAGPSVFVSGTAVLAHADSGPHHRWSSGILFDNITVSGDAINIRDRGNMGTGHGWAGANSVVWNSKADSFILQNPPTAQNWLIGSVGTLVTEGGKVGTYDSLGARVSLGDTVNNPTDSLYKAQLLERRASGIDLRFWVGDQGTSWASGTGGWTNWSRTLGTRTNSPAPASQNDVVFNVTGSTALTTRPGVSTTVSSVQFDAPTAAVTLRVGGTSGTLTLGGNGITVFSGSQSITGDAGGSGAAGDVLLSASQAWEVRGTSQLAFNARLGAVDSSARTLVKLGSGTLSLLASSGGANSLKAAWSIAEGTVKVANSEAFGWSFNNAAVESGAAVQLVDVGLGIANGTLALRGMGVSGTGGALRSLSGTNTLPAGAGAILLDSGSTGIGVDTGILTIARAISGTGGLVKTGSGRLLLSGTGTYSGGTSLSAGTLEVRSAAAMAAASSAAPGRLTITGGTLTLPVGQVELLELALLSVNQTRGRLDLGAGRIQVAAGGITAAELKADLLAGRAGGLWSGTSGITSSAVAAASGQPRSIGWLVAGDGSMLVGFAAPGDTNLDGLVNVLDAANLMASGRYNTGAAADWQHGDFNYDGIVDVLDAASMMSSGLYGAGEYLPVAAAQVVSVPEPAAATSVSLGVWSVAAWSRWLRTWFRSRSVVRAP